MPESNLSKSVMSALKPWDRMRVENPALPGTPDVNYCCGEGKEGWIELKQVDAWPKRTGTPLRIPHFTPQQRVWLTRRRYKGGRAYVLLQVSNDFLLFSGTVAAEILGDTTRSELIKKTIAHWESKEEMTQSLKQCLSQLHN